MGDDAPDWAAAPAHAVAWFANCFGVANWVCLELGPAEDEWAEAVGYVAAGAVSSQWAARWQETVRYRPLPATLTPARAQVAALTAEAARLRRDRDNAYQLMEVRPPGGWTPVADGSHLSDKLYLYTSDYDGSRI